MVTSWGSPDVAGAAVFDWDFQVQGCVGWGSDKGPGILGRDCEGVDFGGGFVGGVEVAGVGLDM